jgi:phosphotransferase system HPr-like phosphotransfer protein
LNSVSSIARIERLGSGRQAAVETRANGTDGDRAVIATGA